MINRVILTGRLTKDPELRYTPSGVAVCTFTLAVNRTYENNGEKKADFINIVVWRKQAENTANYCKKGALVGVDGKLESRSYDGQDGKKVFVTEVNAESVQFLDTKSGSNNQQQSQSSPPPQNNQQQSQNYQQQPPPYNQQQQPPQNNQQYGNYQQPPYNNQGGSYQQQPPNYNQQQNRSYPDPRQMRMDDDPFRNDGQPIDISDDDLPF